MVKIVCWNDRIVVRGTDKVTSKGEIKESYKNYTSMYCLGFSDVEMMENQHSHQAVE